MNLSIRHAPHCEENYLAALDLQKRYTGSFPFYCRRCNGSGRSVNVDRRDLVSHRELCPDCLGIGVCPRCAGQGFDPNVLPDACVSCGYEAFADNGMPELPSCCCGIGDDARGIETHFTDLCL